MLPSRRLIIMVAAAAPMFLIGSLIPPALALAVIYVGVLALYALVDALMLPRRRQITIERALPERLSLGVATLVSYRVRNATRRKVLLQLAEDLSEHMSASPAASTCTLAPGARAEVPWRLRAVKRGRYELDALDVRVLPAMGLWHRQFRLSLPAEVRVFPNLQNIKQYELMLRRGSLYEQGLARLRHLGLGWDFESLRTYTRGDDMHRIDRKATAKRNRLIIKNYEIERQQSIVIAIDVGRATAGEFEGISRLDYLVNAALMLAWVCLRQGDWVSLVAFSDRIESYLPPVRGVKNIDRVARALHELEPRLVEADYGAACRFMGLKNRKRSLLCLMTDVIDRDASEVIIAYLARFARYHLPLAVTLANPEVRELAHAPLTEAEDLFGKAAALDVQNAREEALAAMRHQGVDVLDVAPKALTVDLINRYLRIKATRRL